MLSALLFAVAAGSIVFFVVIGVLLLAGLLFALVGRSAPRGDLEPPPAPSGLDGEESASAVAVAEEEPSASPVATAPETEQVDEARAPAPSGSDVDAPAADTEVAPPEEAPPLVAPSFRDRLAKARSAFSGAIGAIRGRSTIDQDTWDELEEALLRADVGVGPTQDLLDTVRARVKQQGIDSPEPLLDALKEEMKHRLLAPIDLRFAPGEGPTVWLFVGVNGVGKTTTIGKVAARLRADGRSVVLAAGDTFRAAAAEQLGMWAERSGAELVRGAEGGDPSAVIFDAVAHAHAIGTEVVLADTAGRLHTKSNLMEELGKVRRVADKGEGQVTEVLLVLDATTGQNGLQQARQFTEAVELTGVVLTKLDGSAKGGIVLAIQSELGIPVKLVGLGESAADLVEFDPDAFVEALFAE